MSARTYHVVKWHIEPAVTDREDTSLLIVSFPERDDFTDLELSIDQANEAVEMLRDELTNSDSDPVELGPNRMVWVYNQRPGIRLMASYGPGGREAIDLNVREARQLVSELSKAVEWARYTLDTKIVNGAAAEAHA